MNGGGGKQGMKFSSLDEELIVASSQSKLLPVLRWKFDEFFFRWMALPETVQYMEQIANKIANHEDPSSVTWPSEDRTNSSLFSTPNNSGFNNSTNSASGSSNQSNVGTPTPTPPALASPRNSGGRHGKKGSFSPRNSSANQGSKVLSPRGSDGYPSTVQSVSHGTPTQASAQGSSPRLSSDTTAYNSQLTTPAQGTNKADVGGSPSALGARSSSTGDSILTTSETKPEVIPRFYYPTGVPLTNAEIQQVVTRLRDAFEKLPNRKANKMNIQSIMRVCGLPLYTRVPLLTKCKISDPQNGFVSADTFISTWKNIIKEAHDTESRFVRVVSKTGADYLMPGDLECMLQDVVDTHKGLLFLQEAKDFHSRYITTVISRIFYTVNRSWSGKLSVPEIRNSNLLQTFEQLQHEEDINRIRDFFSYEHFYVIYCKFWDLDLDRDLLLSHADLCKHESHSVSQKAIDRIFQGTVSKKLSNTNMKMSYNDFVWFLISEEDKQTPTSVEYWFRVMDLDGDGVLSMYELEFFWQEQLQRMVQQDFADLLPFEDILCEMLDLVKPANPGKITLSDLKKCKLTHVFLNTFINFKKFLDIQQRQNVGFYRDEEESNMTDWEKYANEEYERLVSEDGDQESYLSYEDDFEPAVENSPTTSLSMSALNSAEISKSRDYVIGTPTEQVIEFVDTPKSPLDSSKVAKVQKETDDVALTDKYVEKLDLDVLKLSSS